MNTLDAEEYKVRSGLLRTAELLMTTEAESRHIDRLRNELHQMIRRGSQLGIPTVELARLTSLPWTRIFDVLDDTD